MSSAIHRRIEALEGLERRVRPERQPGSSTDAREQMKAHLAQVAALRRGELSPEEAAEVEAMNAALERERERRMRQSRGEGAS
jgi:hypothetical protein